MGEDTGVEQPALTDAQRSRFLAAVRGRPDVGTVAALREIGLVGSSGELRRMVDKDLKQLANKARRATDAP